MAVGAIGEIQKIEQEKVDMYDAFTEAANEVTSQIIHSQGGILGIMQQPAIIKSYTTDDLWTLEQLDQLIPELVESKKYHDEEVAEKGAPKKV